MYAVNFVIALSTGNKLLNFKKNSTNIVVVVIISLYLLLEK